MQNMCTAETGELELASGLKLIQVKTTGCGFSSSPGEDQTPQVGGTCGWDFGVHKYKNVALSLFGTEK